MIIQSDIFFLPIVPCLTAVWTCDIQYPYLIDFCALNTNPQTVLSPSISVFEKFDFEENANFQL